MIIAYDYIVKEDEETGFFKVRGKFAAFCPYCGNLLTGYDTRKRIVIGDDRKPTTFLLRRLRCGTCRKLHLEIPSFIAPHKHYSAETIRQVLQEGGKLCPADDSTIRRWKQKK